MAVAGEAGAPTVFALSPVAPNPVTGASTLRYALPVATRVSLTVVDALGREVVRLVEGERGAGWHVARVPPGLSSGTYVVRLSAGTFAATQRMAVVR